MMMRIFGWLGWRGFVMLAMGAALALSHWRAERLGTKIDACNARLAQEQMAHETSRRSIARLENAISLMNDQARKRADEYAKSLSDARRAAVRAEMDAEATRHRIKRIGVLEASTGKCETTGDLAKRLAKELEGI